MAAGAENVLLKLRVLAPPKGVAHSLQGKDGEIVDARVSTGRTLTFEILARLEEGKTGWRFLSDFVRTEGKTRRFVYVGIGKHAGQPHTHWDRRAKVDLPEVTPAMIQQALAGKLVLDGSYAGTDARGEPACATVKVEWVMKEAAR
ncbi:MAG: hypothetical protein EON61_17755 [Alphaproteobacteria bacterium]|nr:MAG: hypothetical protein EON61_17755 [Alphaproteobacteria bacterium]